jgi:hypothetical protein
MINKSTTTGGQQMAKKTTIIVDQDGNIFGVARDGKSAQENYELYIVDIYNSVENYENEFGDIMTNMTEIDAVLDVANLDDVVADTSYTNIEDLLDNESVCQLCDSIYNITQDSDTAKESGEFICQNCWDKQEPKDKRLAKLNQDQIETLEALWIDEYVSEMEWDEGMRTHPSDYFNDTAHAVREFVKKYAPQINCEYGQDDDDLCGIKSYIEDRVIEELCKK